MTKVLVTPRLRRNVVPAALLTLLLLISSAFAANAQAQNQANASSSPLESGKFRLHKLELPIGEESYEIVRDGDSLVTRSSFEFTDRGRRVPLSATLRTRQDLTPENFEIKGSVSRFSTIDSAVGVSDNKLSIREGKETRSVPVPAAGFFTLGGYAPVSMQMMMLRYVQTHRTGNKLQVLPGGTVTIEKRGQDTVKMGDGEMTLDRYSVDGLIWGREALWMDDKQNLIAAVTVDGEFDHFEAIREGYEPNLTFFVSRAAEDGMAALAELGGKLSPASKKALVVSGATLIDGTGRAPINDAVVVIENGRITAAGPRAEVKVPNGARVIDAKGKTVLPGLWDMHAHFEQVEWGPVYLAAGVTTVRDVGNEFEFIKAVRDAIQQGKGLGPRMLLAGIVDGDSPTAFGVIHANTPEEARAVVDKYKNAGFQQIKIYSSVKPDIVKAISEEAHTQGMTVTGHIPNGMNAFEGVEAGMDQINHIQYIAPLMRPNGAKPGKSAVASQIDFQSPEAQKAIKFLKDHGTVVDPTMAIFEWSLHPSDVPFSTIEPGAAKLPVQLSGAINNSGVGADFAPRARAMEDQFMATIGALHRAGIPIVAGTDQVVPGHSLHREIELYVKAGFTPMEAIQAATIVPARVMKLDKETGTVEAGKAADLIILDANPLENISNIRTVRSVITAGKLYNTTDLWQSVGFKP
jgi:imidazolonepropionase-like amidohydrolase